jgi:dihydrofolate synthase / folylpolyglutamate synthase
VDPLEYLFGLERLGMKFGLENMTRICRALDHPERAFKSVIVAGTNGKGSVSAMLSAALHAAGHRTGRYTSPHLERLEERFVIAEREVATDRLREAVARVQKAVEALIAGGGLDGHPTFFECATAAAFVLFREARVDPAILEVGLGGRLDATNVVTPVAAAITSIALDHQAQLGNTLAAIAREKAGVIKRGIPVVCGPVPEEADTVIAEVCHDLNARLVRSHERVESSVELVDGETIVSMRTPHHRFDRIALALRGRHQAVNATTAVTLLEELDSSAAGLQVDRNAILAGLTNTQWPGRLERFRHGATDVLLDAAHNPAGAHALATYLKESGWSDATLVFGAMGDKDLAGMLAALAPATSRVICATAANPRAASATELVSIAASVGGWRPAEAIEAIDDPEAALQRACDTALRVVVAGSIFLIGPLRGILR